MKMNTFVGNTRHFDNEMDLALRSTPTLFQLRFAFVNFLTFDQAEQFMSGRPFQDVIVSRNWRPLSPSCIRSTCSFASTGNSTSSFYHMVKLTNNAFVGNTRHFLDDEIECDPVLPQTIRPTLTKQSDLTMFIPGGLISTFSGQFEFVSCQCSSVIMFGLQRKSPGFRGHYERYVHIWHSSFVHIILDHLELNISVLAVANIFFRNGIPNIHSRTSPLLLVVEHASPRVWLSAPVEVFCRRAIPTSPFWTMWRNCERCVRWHLRFSNLLARRVEGVKVGIMSHFDTFCRRQHHHFGVELATNISRTSTFASGYTSHFRQRSCEAGTFVSCVTRYW